MGLSPLKISLFAVLWGIWFGRNNRIFREKEKSGEEVWENLRFNASLWVSVTRPFVIMVLVLFFFLDCSPFF